MTGVVFSQRTIPKLSIWVKRGAIPHLKTMIEPFRAEFPSCTLIIYLPHQSAGESIIL